MIGIGLPTLARPGPYLGVGRAQLTFAARRPGRFRQRRDRAFWLETHVEEERVNSTRLTKPDPTVGAKSRARMRPEKLPGAKRHHGTVPSVLIVAACCGLVVVAALAPVARAQLILSAVAIIAVWFRPSDK